MRTFHRDIIFTKTPLTGFFRYRDVFQIYPADLENMPKSLFQRHYPVILEYWTDDLDIISIKDEYPELTELFSQTATTLNKVDRIINLLTVISNHLFFRYYDNTGMWGIPVLEDHPGKKANEWSAKWNMPLFHWPELTKQLVINDFTSLNLEEVKYVRHFDYYLFNPNFDYYPKTIINFPNTIKVVLDSYFSKKSEIQNILDTAISFSVSAMELREYRKTLSLIASFTSVETMVNFEFHDFKPEACKVCGQLKYKVAQKYRDFFYKYVGKGEHNKRKLNYYYELRSKIIHTGRRLKIEKPFNNLSKEESDKEFLDQIEILQLGKMAIVHWLIKNK